MCKGNISHLDLTTNKFKNSTICDKYLPIMAKPKQDNKELIEALKTLDINTIVDWLKGVNLSPSFQKVVFFPELCRKQALNNWESNG